MRRRLIGPTSALIDGCPSARPFWIGTIHSELRPVRSLRNSRRSRPETTAGMNRSPGSSPPSFPGCRPSRARRYRVGAGLAGRYVVGEISAVRRQAERVGDAPFKRLETSKRPVLNRDRPDLGRPIRLGTDDLQLLAVRHPRNHVDRFGVCHSESDPGNRLVSHSRHHPDFCLALLVDVPVVGDLPSIGRDHRGARYSLSNQRCGSGGGSCRTRDHATRRFRCRR